MKLKRIKLYIIFKSIIDINFAFILLIISLPVLILLGLLLTITNSGNPFFFQKRPGKDGKIFSIIKLKTMNDKQDVRGNLLPDEQRITKIGKVIRKFSLDEIPQVINVISGKMSFVGPRPLLPEYLSIYNETQKKRHFVKPGITGWAQVNGRNAISWKQKLELDVWYANNLSFFLDVKIILLTIKKVIKREGISSESSVTVEKFNGTN